MTDTNVVVLPGAEMAPSSLADPEMIRMLEDLLEKARGGDVKSVAYAIETFRGGEIQTAWFRNKGSYSPMLLGAVQYLQGRMLRRMMEDEL